jgi:agmatine/peptidylarginine deiminase
MRNRVSTLAVLALLFGVWLQPLPLRAQAQPTVGKALDVESLEESVVLLAIGEVRDQNPAARADFAKLQRDIARAALEFTPVVVFIDEHIDHTAVRTVFKADPAMARALDDGRLVFFVVPHDTPWVRDYGPQVKLADNGDFVLVDSRYQDLRHQMDIDRKRKVLNDQRNDLIKRFWAITGTAGPGAGDGQTKEGGQPKNAATLTEIKDRLFVLQQQDEILANGKVYDRKDDDYAPYEMMQAVTGRADITVQRPDLFLDGGNLLRLSDGRLLSSKDLFLRNHGKENGLNAQLKKYFDVREVHYLEPLPGPVIKHVDMFLLPAVGKRMLLASYEDEPSTEGPKVNGTSHARVLTELAAAAMKKNKTKLTKLGYEVIDVPALPPVVSGNLVYYPTLLNALTLRTKAGYAVLVPYYPNLDQYVQFAAYKVIRKAFGPDVHIVPVDCTSTAPLQGAVHCLTATVPLRFSIFADGAAVAGGKQN